MILMFTERWGLALSLALASCHVCTIPTDIRQLNQLHSYFIGI